MNSDTLMKLYHKEREYQKKVFGDCKKNPILSSSSFLIFLDTYLNKAKLKMCEDWTTEKPDWLIHCREHDFQELAPVEMYEYLIKIFALTGACLETYIEVDPEFWRSEGVNPKWKKR